MVSMTPVSRFLSVATILTLSSPSFGFTMASLGDSISTAFNATGYGENIEESWATGGSSVINSHFTRLDALMGGKVDVYNYAKSGATSDDLQRQVSQVTAYKPDYATLLIGGNDLCHDYGETDEELFSRFTKNVEEAIQTLKGANDQVKILLVPIPDLYHLYEVSKNERSCRQVWWLTGLCKPLLSARKTPAERDAFKVRLGGLNQILSDLAAANQSYVRIDSSLAQTRFSLSDISPIDCFHPSQEGQKLLSELTWTNGWYSNYTSRP